MGMYQLLYTAVGAIVVVTVLVGGRMFLYTNYLNVDIQSQITQKELNAVSISYSLIECMKQDKDSVDAMLLEQMDICSLCNICGIDGIIRFYDLETVPVKQWDILSETPGGEPGRYSLYLDIDYGDESHIGRLDVHV